MQGLTFSVKNYARKKLNSNSSPVSQADFEKMAIQLREKAIKQNHLPSSARHFIFGPGFGFGKYPWHRSIMTTVFWIGESSISDHSSSTWDRYWQKHYGGYDNPNPSCRHNFIPKGMTPLQNPFYCALPYCDIDHGKHKPEALFVIPWFRQCFEKEGKSVLKGRWIAIDHNGRTCFAQWEDCGPFRTDHWQYVFGNGLIRPSRNLNSGAGLDISPAVRDYLEIHDGNVLCNWKFVDASNIPDGPWKLYGNNNTFVLCRHGMNLYMNDRNNAYQIQSTYSTQRHRFFF